MPTTQKQPNSVDLSVGSRARLRRNMLRMSQEKLAGTLGITFQQVQKYESGANRISASRLQTIAGALDVSPSYFFDAEGVAEESAGEAGQRFDASGGLTEFLTSTEGLALNLAFGRISDAEVRRRLVNLVKAIGSHDRDGQPVRAAER
jgi:transcriptional regulator with XRE-family HTH domain